MNTYRRKPVPASPPAPAYSSEADVPLHDGSQKDRIRFNRDRVRARNASIKSDVPYLRQGGLDPSRANRLARRMAEIGPAPRGSVADVQRRKKAPAGRRSSPSSAQHLSKAHQRSGNSSDAMLMQYLLSS